MSKFFIDTEFMEDGKTIELLSIGIVHESQATYYCEPEEVDWSRANPWVKEHVIPHLGKGMTKPRKVIAENIIRFVDYYSRNDTVVFYGYYADYDWVAFCQLFGTMMDLPEHFPRYCRDIKQMADQLGNLRLPKHDLTLDGPEHDALSDAKWIRRSYEFIKQHVAKH